MVQETPLKGRVIAITRPTEQTEEAGKLISNMGGKPYFIPAIEIKGLSNLEPVKSFVSDLGQGKVDYTILMSTNGVKYLFAAADELKLTSQLKIGLNKTFLIAVGPQTAEALEKSKIRVDLIPTKYSSEGIIESLKDKSLHGKKIVIPRTSNASPVLKNRLHELGGNVEEIYVYESGLPEDADLKNKFFNDLATGKIDAIVFGSGLSAKNIFKMLLEKTQMEQLKDIIQKNVTVVVAIGPTTAEALQEMGIGVDVMPTEYLFEKALLCLAQFWASSQEHK